MRNEAIRGAMAARHLSGQGPRLSGHSRAGEAATLDRAGGGPSNRIAIDGEVHMARSTALPTGPGDWFGQPRGLAVLFLTATWECFSFYGMRALLVYYMIKSLGFAQGKASLVYGVYTACIFLTPIFGGAIADRWLGRRPAVIIGGATMALGHFILPSDGLFYPGLACIALGNGLFLPSLPSQIAGLYAEHDARRNGAYNVYYLGVNLGGFVAPLACGTLGEALGWHWGFGAAGLGMLIGLVIYVAGGRWLPEQQMGKQAAERGRATLERGVLRRRLWLLAGAAGAVIVFRAAYEQLGNTIALWADKGIDRGTAIGVIPMTWFQSVNALMVILLTPLLIGAWRRGAARGREISPLRRMAIGAAIVALSYGLLGIVAAWGAGGSVSWLWLLGFLTLLTFGELWILPVGLGLFGRLAPAGYAATTIAAWFFAGFAGNLLAGLLGATWDRTTPAKFFMVMAVIALFAATLLRLLDRPARQVEAEGLPVENR
jgi:POT family proton-dependent oligopeptide transporter